MKLKSKSKTKIIILVVIIILIVVGSITGYFVYRKNRSNKHNTENTVYLQNKKKRYRQFIQIKHPLSSFNKYYDDNTKKFKCIKTVYENNYECDEFLEKFYHYDPENFNYDPGNLMKKRGSPNDEERWGSLVAWERYINDQSDQTNISYLVNLSGIKTVNGKPRYILSKDGATGFGPNHYPMYMFGDKEDPSYELDPTNFKLENLNKKDASENIYSFTFTIKPLETVKLKGIRFAALKFTRIIISSQNGEVICDADTSKYNGWEYGHSNWPQIDENDIKNNLLVKNQEYNVTFWVKDGKPPESSYHMPRITGLKFYI